MSRVPEHILQAIRDRLPLSGIIGRHVRLKRTGADHTGLCPFHNERSPSFTVNDGKGFYHCFGCGAHGDIFRWLAENEGLDFRAAVARAGDLAGVDTRQWTQPASGHLTDAVSKPENAAARRLRAAGTTKVMGGPEAAAWAAARRAREEEQRQSLAKRIAYALELWRGAQRIGGTPGEVYFRGRGITCDLPVSLRFHPAVPHPMLRWRPLPAVVAAVQKPDAQLLGVWRIYLAPDGKGGWRKAGVHEGLPPKEGAKLGLGDVRGGAVRLCRAYSGLAVAEGIETALAVMSDTPGQGCWAALSWGGMAGIVLPEIVTRPLIIMDHDSARFEASKSRPFGIWRRPGIEGGLRLAYRCIAQRRHPRLWLSAHEGNDFLDDLVASGSAGRGVAA
ncbi:CHC2 zinc finger domain-containing protein [Oceanibaculum indicum]|uniref:DNA primase n=1 Tax=Oceanibaculum indicum P24 TaxID=1207063 RepID=K2IFE6_9PROT|nr:CHC2 zinc finger domain-containing protein [Oceanibaculum indicum]EKE68706.1 DNA primase [Oceanibaculum indicum P24]